MLNLLKNELYKLKKSKVFYSFLFCIAAQAVVVYAIPDKPLLLSGKEMFEYITNVQNGLATNILVGIFVAECIVTEFTSGYIKNLITYGHKRTTIFVSKAIVYYVSIIIMGLILPIGMMIINTVMNGYGEELNFKSITYLLGMIFLMAIIQVGIGSLNLLVAFLSRNLNITMVAAIGFDFLNRSINIMFVQKSYFLWAINNYVYSQPAIITADNVVTRDFIQAIAVSVVTIIITTTIAIYSFNKADIK